MRRRWSASSPASASVPPSSPPRASTWWRLFNRQWRLLKRYWRPLNNQNNPLNNQSNPLNNQNNPLNNQNNPLNTQRRKTRNGHDVSATYWHYTRMFWDPPLLSRPSLSWADLVASVQSALHQCAHTATSTKCCCLCLLQALESHVSSNAVKGDLASLVWRTRKTPTLSLEASSQDFATIGGNAALKACLYDYIINPCLHMEVGGGGRFNGRNTAISTSRHPRAFFCTGRPARERQRFCVRARKWAT